MINSITPKGDLVSALWTGKEIRFKEGINIIVGPNGSGKSSLLKSLAQACGIDWNAWGPRNTYGTFSVSSLYGEKKDLAAKASDPTDGFSRSVSQPHHADICWSGRPVGYFNPTLYEKSGSFDLQGGLLDEMESLSLTVGVKHAQHSDKSLRLIVTLLDRMKKVDRTDQLPAIADCGANASRYGDAEYYIKLADQISALRAAAKPTESAQTWLIDELDAHLDTVFMLKVFENLVAFAGGGTEAYPKHPKTQIIWITHNYALLARIKNDPVYASWVHFIEPVPGFLDYLHNQTAAPNSIGSAATIKHYRAGQAAQDKRMADLQERKAAAREAAKLASGTRTHTPPQETPEEAEARKAKAAELAEAARLKAEAAKAEAKLKDQQAKEAEKARKLKERENLDLVSELTGLKRKTIEKAAAG